MPTVVIADDSPTLRRIVTHRPGARGLHGRAGRGRRRGRAGRVPRTARRRRARRADAARLRLRRRAAAQGRLADRGHPDPAADLAGRRRATATGARRPVPTASSPRTSRRRSWSRPSTRCSARADAARGGRPPLRPDPVELPDDDVLARVCDLLDRKLFESSVAAEVTAIAADVHGFEETVAAVLGVLSRIVDYDLAAVCMLDDRVDVPDRRARHVAAAVRRVLRGRRRRGHPGDRRCR